MFEVTSVVQVWRHRRVELGRSRKTPGRGAAGTRFLVNAVKSIRCIFKRVNESHVTKRSKENGHYTRMQ
jgi:hypothetical protein